MTYEEAKKAIDGFKESGRTDEEIVATFYLMFQDDKINVKELGDLVGLVGYELTDEFLNMSPEDQKTKVFEEDEDSEEETVEETKKEPAKETVEDEKSETENKDSADEPKEPTEKIEKDDTQEEKALKLFGLK